MIKYNMKYKCNKCQSYFSTEFLLNKHVNKSISCDKPLKCSRCEVSFTDITLYNRHLNRKLKCKISKTTPITVESSNIVLELELAKINLERDRINFEKAKLEQNYTKKNKRKEMVIEEDDEDITDYSSVKEENKPDNDIESENESVISNNGSEEDEIINDSSEGEEVDEIETARIMKKYGLGNTPAQNTPKLDEVSQKHKEFSDKLMNGLAVKNSRTGRGNFNDLMKFEMERISGNGKWNRYDDHWKKSTIRTELGWLIKSGLDSYLQKKLDDTFNYTSRKTLSDDPASSKFIFYNKETDTFYNLCVKMSTMILIKKEYELVPIEFNPFLYDNFSKYLNNIITFIHKNISYARPERTWQDFKGTKEMYETLDNAIKDRYVFNEKLIKECAVAVFSPKEEDY
jgi:uncharacterized C2H2 Zn-finger protein